MNISKTLSLKFPDRIWKLKGNKYQKLVMMDGLPKPTEAELETAWQEILTEEAAVEYLDKRREEYPSIDERIEALWYHVVQNKPEQANALDIEIKKIDKKYPKP